MNFEEYWKSIEESCDYEGDWSGIRSLRDGWNACKDEVLKILKNTIPNNDYPGAGHFTVDKRFIEEIQKL